MEQRFGCETKLLHQRGLAPSTAGQHTQRVAALLTALGDNPACYTAETI